MSCHRLFVGLLGLTVLLLGLPEAQAQMGAGPGPKAKAGLRPLTVKLLTAGKAPLRPLRYQFKAGSSSTLVMEMTMTLSLVMGDKAIPEVKTPVLRTHMRIKNEEVTAEGNLRYSFMLERHEVVAGTGALPEPVMQKLKNDLKQMEGLKGWALVSPRGLTLDGDIQVPPLAEPSIRQMMENMREQLRQLSSPLPEEPVGIGASWQVDTAHNLSGIMADQTSIHTLTALKGDRGQQSIALKQKAPAQTMKNDKLPPGFEMKLLSLSSEGKGKMSFDLKKLVPSSEMTIAMEMKTRVVGGGQEQAMTMNMKMDMRIK